VEHFVTLFDKNFLPQGISLHLSMQRNVKNYKLWILCIDDYTYELLKKIKLPNVSLLRFSELETNELKSIKSTRSNREYCWTLTPFAPKFVFDADISVSRVTYLDADMWFRSDPSRIFDELGASGKSVLVTDHAYATEHEQSKTSGQYCVQFIVFTRDSGEDVRQWWQDRCIEWCYTRFEDGKFGDQKYLEQWPLLFPEKVLVSKGMQWFMAPWNSTRFDLDSAICWHFHGLRIIKLFGKFRIHGGDYWLPMDVKEYIYRPYISDIQEALKILKAHHSPCPLQNSLSLRSRIKYFLTKIRLFQKRFLSLNVFEFDSLVLAPITRITLITVCRNASKYIEETLESVLQQTAVKSARVELEYLVIDGLSDDGTQELILDIFARHPEVRLTKLISEADQGLYDGLAKAISLSTGDVIGYINAGDYLNHHALDILLSVFRNHPNESWVTGLNVIYSDLSQVVGVSMPFRYRPSLIRKGLYGKFLPIIQQESTFWRSSLNKTIDLNFLKKLHYSGDAYLWKCFSRFANLTIVQAYLGGFRIHKGQISSNMIAYYKEQDSFSDSPNFLDYIVASFDWLIFHMPYKVKKFFNSKGIFSFNHKTGAWE
jgi:glycosyltransferase involved in cell wall biosynthesis